MDERAKIPVSLPRDKPTVAFWQDPPDASIADVRSTSELPEFADVVIIGSGITGAAVAWHLLSGPSPPSSVLMLEARQASSGATGRNGGHTKAASYRFFPEHAARHGIATACQIARLELATINAVHEFAAQHNLDCDSHPCQTIDVFYSRAFFDEGLAAIAAMQAAMPGDPAAEYDVYTPAEVQARFHCGGDDDIVGGVGYAAGSLWPYRFVAGVLRLCLERGMNLQTGTAAVGLRRVVAAPDADGQPPGLWEVETATRGTVRASRVVVATNGYTAALIHRLQGCVVPLRGQVAMHRPPSDDGAGQAPLERTYSLVYDEGYEYMIPRPPGSQYAGDIIIGGGAVAAVDGGLAEYGTTDDGSLDDRIRAYLREAPSRYFGDAWGKPATDDQPDSRIRMEWSGIMGFTPDGLPLVGEMPGEPGLWLACAFQGHGMVFSWKCAAALVEMMQESDGPVLRDWFPDVFRPTAERMRMRFQGRPHSAAVKTEVG